MATINNNTPTPQEVWGRRSEAAKSAPAEGDISDLVPEPITAEAAFKRFHGKFAHRGKYK